MKIIEHLAAEKIYISLKDNDRDSGDPLAKKERKGEQISVKLPEWVCH